MKFTLSTIASLLLMGSATQVMAMAHADPSTFTCAQYMELDEAGQQEAADALQAAETEAGGGMMAEDGTTPLEGADLSAAVTEKCSGEGMGEMTLTDAAMAE